MSTALHPPQLCGDAKPCPFCGSPALLADIASAEGGTTPRVILYCSNESTLEEGGCAARPRVFAETSVAALEQWNRRAGPNKLIVAQAVNRLRQQAREVAAKDPGNEMVRDLATVFAYIATRK